MKKGFGPFGPKGFGPMGHAFRGGFGRMRRGDVKVLVLRALKDDSRHGYEIMDALEQESGYRPSPGSIYPTLQMLEEGGFVTGEQIDGKKVFTITDKGRELLEERGSEQVEVGPGMRSASEVRQAMMKLGAAVMQAAREGDAETTKKVLEVLDKSRKEVYSILASS